MASSNPPGLPIPSFEALNASLASYLDTLIPSKFARSQPTSSTAHASSSTSHTKSNPFDVAGPSNGKPKEKLFARPGAVDSKGRLLYAKPVTAQDVMAEAGAKQRDRRNLEIAQSKALKSASSSDTTHSALLKRKISEAQLKNQTPFSRSASGSMNGNAEAGPSKLIPSSTSHLCQRINGQFSPVDQENADAASDSEEEEESRTRSVGKKTAGTRALSLGNGKGKKGKATGKAMVQGNGIGSAGGLVGGTGSGGVDTGMQDVPKSANGTHVGQDPTSSTSTGPPTTSTTAQTGVPQSRPKNGHKRKASEISMASTADADEDEDDDDDDDDLGSDDEDEDNEPSHSTSTSISTNPSLTSGLTPTNGPNVTKKDKFADLSSADRRRAKKKLAKAIKKRAVQKAEKREKRERREGKKMRKRERREGGLERESAGAET